MASLHKDPQNKSPYWYVAFTLYEDANNNYNDEKGIHASIPFAWDGKQQVLTIGEREGRFPGMLEKRTFCVV